VRSAARGDATSRKPDVRAQSRRIATPSMMTLEPLVLTLSVSVPVRADGNVVTAMSFFVTVVADRRLIVLRRVEFQYTLTFPQVGHVVARIAIRRATTPLRMSLAPSVDERTYVEA
jgi:hypothetical protein